MLGLGVSHTIHCNRAIQRHQPSTVMYSKRELVGIGDLLWTMEFRVIEDRRIQKTEIVRPKAVIGRRRGPS